MVGGKDMNPAGKRSIGVWLTLVAVVVAVGAGAYSYLKGSGEAGGALDGLAAAAPPDAQFFLSADLRDQYSTESLLKEINDFKQQNPDAARKIEEAEKQAGITIAEVGRWAQPAGYVAFLPHEGQKSLIPSSEWSGRPFELVVALAVANEDAARQTVESALKKSAQVPQEVQQDGVKLWVISKDDGQLAVGIGHRYLWLGTGPATVGRAIRAASGKGGSLASQPQYVEAGKAVHRSKGVFAYVALRDLLGSVGALPEFQRVADEETLKAIQGLEYFAGACDLRPSGEAQMFLKVDPKAESPFIKSLLEARELNPTIARFFPAKWGSYVSLNAVYVGSVLYQLAHLVPASRTYAGGAPTLARMYLGFDVIAEFQKASEGDVAYTSDGLKSLPVRADWPKTGAPKTNVLFALSLKDPAAASGIVSKLEDKIRQRSRVIKKVGDTEIRGYDRLSVRWAMVSQPQPAFLLAEGPEAEQRLAESVASASKPGESVESLPDLKALLETKQGKVVESDYTDLTPLLGIVSERLGRMGASTGGDASADRTRRAAIEWVQKKLKGIGRLTTTSVVSVETEGIRMRTRGLSAMVAAVGGIGGAVFLPNFIRARANGQATACRSNLKNMATALEMYSTDNSGRFPTELSRLTPNYLKYVPTCPAVGRDSYGGGYACVSHPDAFTLVCNGQNHAGAGCSSNYPQYSSVQGLLDR